MKRRVILASASPRRRALLEKMLSDFEVIASNAEETAPRDGDPAETAVGNALAKANAVAADNPDAVVIGADSVVVHQGRIFGKPGDRAEAMATLRLLSGGTHCVITGVAIVCTEKRIAIADHEVTHIKFRNLGDSQISQYLDTCEYLDKAGSYGIQDVGEAFAESVEGDLDNVVGLPLKLLSKMIAEMSRMLVP